MLKPLFDHQTSEPVKEKWTLELDAQESNTATGTPLKFDASPPPELDDTQPIPGAAAQLDGLDGPWAFVSEEGGLERLTEIRTLKGPHPHSPPTSR